ncbi:hypothetical protein MHU86_16592 [Fragilaria crotonensis]|nr:hypothetical protein MHU86_16592 [Fragilaria crotonensis]
MFSHLLLTTTPGLSAFPSVKNARNKTPQRQGTEPFHRLHLDLMRNPFRYGLTTNSNYSAYLFIVTTPGKLTGWIGLPTESTTSILIALKQWLTDTELLGRTQSVRFIRTDAGSAFTSTKFISECTSLGIKVEAAAPEHQEMNGICEAKWREVHNTANILLNNARLELITYKQQLQRASRGIFLGFPDNSAGWLVYSPDQPQSLVITRDAYFDEDFNSALCFDSKPFAGAVPIRSHFNPNGLCNTPENSEPSTFHQTGSAANLGNPPSTFIDDTNPLPSLTAIPESTDDNTDEQPPGTMPNPTHADHTMKQSSNMVQHHPHHIKSTLSPINNIIPNSTR